MRIRESDPVKDDMTNQSNILRSLVIYGICLPLAVLLGYLLSNPFDIANSRLTMGNLTVGILFAVLITPILLRFHHAMLIVFWNMSAVAFFLPGRPDIWLGMAFVSFLVCIVHRTLDKRFRFISVPEVTRPLIVLIVVVLVTAEATGGFGVRALGSSDIYGGKRYFFLLGAILGYFAFTSQKISAKHAVLFTAIFFLSGLTSLIGDLAIRGGELIQHLTLIFPSFSGLSGENALPGVTRNSGLSAFSTAFFYFMMSKYGVRGIFTAYKPWRAAILIIGVGVGLTGGYRSFFLMVTLVFCVQFFLEGMHRTKLFPIALLLLIMCAAVAIPLISQLPPTIQRSISFLPVPVDLNVRIDADGSSDWRLRMWKALLPEVPQYLLLGKGYGMVAQDFTFATSGKAFGVMAGDEWWGAAVAGDYHSGPLSVIITFGLWGAVAILWFLAAACRVLYNNYRYGDPSLRVVNVFLLSAYVAKIMMFLVVVGGISGDMQAFAGWLGLSVCLNGGMARPSPDTVPATEKTGGFVGTLPRPRSVLSR